MKLILAGLLLVVCLPALAAGQKSSGGTDAEFKALIDHYYTAWSSMNPDNAAPMYAKDADLVFYDIAPLKYTSWTEYNKGVRGVFAGFESLKVTPSSDLKLTRHGDIAWTTVTFHMEAKPKGGGAALALDGRHTIIWEKRDGKWLIVHEHFSAPLQG